MESGRAGSTLSSFNKDSTNSYSGMKLESESEFSDCFKDEMEDDDTCTDNRIHGSDMECYTAESFFNTSECAAECEDKKYQQKYFMGKSAGRLNKRARFKVDCKRKDSTRKKPIGCGLCGKTFSFKDNLRTHMKIHKGEKLFFCEECGKVFNRQSYLKRHMVVHMGEKPFACEKCGKKYCSRSALNCHMTIHNGEKPFGCGQCGQRFCRKSNLNQHVMIHTGEKPFRCDDCGKSFNRRADLKRHVKLLAGDKPFCCDQCGHKFSSKSSFIRHWNSHSQQKHSAVKFDK